MADYTIDIIRIVKMNKYEFVRYGKGDHSTWHSPITNRNFIIDGAVEDKHLANLIMNKPVSGINFKLLTY